MKKTALRWLRSPWRFRLFLWWKLPAAAFMGVRLMRLDGESAAVLLPYHWRSQNPFRSIYFAAQCAAAELSTGLPAWIAVQEQPVAVSMLVTRVEAVFIKKAAQSLLFTCRDLPSIVRAVHQAAQSDDAQEVRVLSTGTLLDGSEVARVWVTWSFKRKQNSRPEAGL
jgi:hypothetical protein